MLTKIYFKQFIYSLVIILILFTLLFFFLEICARGYSLLVNGNLCAKSLNIKKYESQFDNELGYVPVPGKKIGCLGESYFINKNLFRDYPNFDEKKSNILIVGDSFGFGDEVSDNETISHYLKKNHNINTINAAVYGYGLDQAFLRANKLSDNFNFNNILLIIAPGGYSRTNVTERNGISKPHFIEIEEEKKLKLIKPKKGKFKYASRSRLVEKSLIFNFVANRINLTEIIVKEKYNKQDDVTIACKITDYFNSHFKKKQKKLKVVFYRDASEVLLENSKNFKKTKRYLNCLKSKNVEFIDTLKILKKNLNRKLYVKNTFGHPTGIANKKVAEVISNDFK